jgi:formate C-acetyltransferase
VELLTQMIEAETSPARRQDLETIRAACRKVPMRPAESFQEALQSVWFVHMLLHSTLTYTPLGRIDQYLWPYYQADIASGRITRDYARELIASFLIKFNERTQFRRDHMENHLTTGDWSQGGSPDEPTAHFEMENDSEYTFGQSANHWLQSATVGGLGLDGKDATNDLSYLFIEIINKLELVSPMISARLHKDSPKEYVEFVSGELCNGGAQPVLFNDDVIVKGLIDRLGIPVEDARDYSSDGCWEVLIYGKTEYTYGHIEVMPAMEALINNGRSLVSKQKIGIDMGDVAHSLKTYEDFYQAFLGQVRHRMDTALKNKMEFYELMQRIAPEPYLSALMQDCLKNGRDLTDKGARYRIYSLFITGLSHAIDSLMAVKKLVYEDKVVSLEEAIRAVKANWEGYESLRQRVLNKVPKYGNDNDEVDAILTRFLNDFCDHADEWNRRVDWLQVSAGVATFENYPRFGHNAWASFDGRVAHEAFSSNFSPAVGRDREGPTAVLLSTAKFDLSRLNSGCPVDLRVSFNKEGPDQNRQVMLGFIRSFVELGCNIMTITRVDLETLRRAQQEPEKYLSLRVRLGGLTAYFVQLAKVQQDEYMRRTEHHM